MVNIKNTVSKFLDTVFSDGVASLFYLFIALPLFYVPHHHIYSRGLRLSYVMVIAFTAILVPVGWKTMRDNLVALNRWIKMFLALSLVLVLISSLFSALETSVLFFGREPDYMGVLAWLSIIPFSLLFAHRLYQLLFSSTTVAIMVAILLISLVMGSKAIIGGYRVPGLMMQATTMAMYAVLACVVSLGVLTQNIQKPWVRKLSMIGVVLSTLTVIVTQSRLGYVGLILACTYFSVRMIPRKSPLIFMLVGVCLLLPLLTLVSNDHFSRLNATSVQRGIEYRMHIYTTTGREVLRRNLLVGDGPSVLPEDLNNSDIVPEDIAKTLREQLVFVSSHDLFLDMALYFGAIVAAGFFLLSGYALLHGLTDAQPHADLRMAFVVLLINALCNTTSPEITALTFMVLLGLLIPQQKRITG